MDERTKQKLIQLNNERTCATELLAAVGQFLDKSHEMMCPRLKKSCDELITSGLNMISHHTKEIAALREQIAVETSAKLPSQVHTGTQGATALPPDNKRKGWWRK